MSFRSHGEQRHQSHLRDAGYSSRASEGFKSGRFTRRSRSRSYSRGRRPGIGGGYDSERKSYKRDFGKHGDKRYSREYKPDHRSPSPKSNGLDEDKLAGVVKEVPNFEVSGVLAEDQNQINGVPLIFTISVDSAVPDLSKDDWRLFEFAGDDTKRSVKLSGFSCFLFGSDTRLTEGEKSTEISVVLLDHESCSKQHAVIQFRNRGDDIKPYLLDLQSSNKTFLNGTSVEPGRYIELRHQDVIVFGRSDSEFVLLNASLS